MRNLKKALAMVLALMMALSLMSFASAVDYPDSGSVTKNEAVDVMSAINVFQGTDGGNFDPNGELTRAQAAKIISYMKLGADGAEALPKDEAPFDDVKADRWYTGYVAYAKAEEIIVGDGDGKFRPNDKVTGYQFGKMVLEAAGIKGEYTGTAAWTINITINLRSNDLLAGIEDISLAKNITREQACQMAFNGLNYAPAAAATGYFYINVTKDDATAKGALPSSVQYATYAEAAAMVSLYNTGKTGGDVLTLGTDYTIIAATDNKGSLAQTVFGLTKKPGNNTTEFGAPARVWQINGKDAVTVATEPTLSYDKAVSGKTIWTDLGKVSTITTTNSVTVDGYTNGSLALNSTNTATVGGNGAKVDVYRNGNNVDIVVVNTYVATVASHTDAKGSNKEKITLAIGDNTNKPSPMPSLDFETTAFTADDKGAVVLYTAAKGETNYTIKSVTVPTEVKGKVTSFNAGKGTFVVDGTTYSFSAKATSVTANRVSADDVGGDEVTLYLDNSGNVIYTKTGNAAPDAVYAVMKGVQATAGWGGIYTYQARLLLTDGSIVEKNLVKFTNASGVVKTSFVSDDARVLNALVIVKYVETDKGLEITEVDKTATEKGSMTKVTRNTPALENASVTANSKTLFLIGNKDGNVWTAYTGITAVPSIKKLADIAADVEHGVEAWTAPKFHVVAKSGVAELVYIDMSEPDSTSTAVSDVVYVVSAGDEVTDSEGHYWEFAAVVNGELTTIKAAASNSVAVGELYSSVNRNEKGFITGKTAMTTEQGALNDAAQTAMTAPANSVITVGGTGYVYNDDTVVYIIDGDGARTVAMTAVADEIANMELSVRGVLKDGVLASLFVKVTPHTHSWASVSEVPATCAATGKAAHYSCTCGAVATKNGENYTIVTEASLVTQKIPHTYSWTTENDKHKGTCSVCSDAVSHDIDWSNWAVADSETKVDGVSEGQHYRVCEATGCGIAAEAHAAAFEACTGGESGKENHATTPAQVDCTTEGCTIKGECKTDHSGN